ncbi:MAG TPA: DUF4340 domain-containing protein [Acidiferrobacteraceae bacterium]|nr:DUF4340 domain-containing protein [Acidiferrobacteraceae bacterium]
MKQRWIINLGLGIIVAVLIWVVIYSPGKTPPPPPITLGSTPADKISEIRIIRPGKKNIRLVKTGMLWRLTAPINARANQFRATSVVGLATTRSDGQLEVNIDKLAQYGLANPLATVWLGDQKLDFGDSHPINRKRYVMTDNRIHLINDTVFRHLTVPFSDYIDSQLLAGIEPTTLELPKLRIKLGDKGWAAKPEPKDISADRITALVDEWRHTRALSVSPYQGKTSGSSLRIGYKDDAKTGATKWLKIYIRSRKPELVLYRPDEGLEYHFPADMAKRLFEIKAQ